MRQAVVVFLAAASFAGAAFSVQAETPSAEQLQQGKELFISKAVPACAVCHTMADAGSSGTIGPDLDEIKPDMAAVKKALREGLGVMPNFSQTLSDEEIDAVAAYVSHAVGK
ncbi:MAG TPA: cytochrome c [Pusillimonas sp.]|uniref:SorU family sulfite dehydrogenase c-type cytochrome subunit n=1 Tax=Pusillimonas sp. TaxID=3040095 RepID=UPI002BDAC7E9|nr:cytochrome c [Pusillimonas sp.]HUH86929.1 cytochrome c [Pusillimonas sp.]